MDGPKLLEFNVRLGDPETQVILPLLGVDFLDLVEASMAGELSKYKSKFDFLPMKAGCCVVMASGGYPAAFEKGLPISGLDRAAKIEDLVVFHAGTTLKDGVVVNNGGRVLGVTGLGDDVAAAIECAYRGVKEIHWQDVHSRKDIGQKALNR